MPLNIGEEQVPAGEDDVIKELVGLQVAIMQKTGPTKRGQHPKHHGGVEAEFTVRDDIPEIYKTGLFKEPKVYKAMVRLSNGAADDDTVRDVHGMAVKVLGVKGPQSLEGAGLEEQDFVLIDNEVFFTPDVKAMLDLMKARVASATVPAVMEAFAKANHSTIERLEAAKKTIASPLAVQYWSTVPYKLGAQAVKYSAVPAADNGSGHPVPPSRDCLRSAMVARLADGNTPALFDLVVIPQTDPATMPIEDPTVRWASDPVPVATLKVNPQTFDTQERMKQTEEMSFDPWHALAEHRPLGGINRARKAVYHASVTLRRKP